MTNYMIENDLLNNDLLNKIKDAIDKIKSNKEIVYATLKMKVQ